MLTATSPSTMLARYGQGVANRVTTNTIHEVPASAVTEIGFVSIALEMETDCIDTVPLAQSTA